MFNNIPTIEEPISEEMEQNWKELENKFEYEFGLSLAEADQVLTPVVEGAF